MKRMICAALLALLCANAGCGDEKDTHFDYVDVPLGSHDVVLAETDVVDVPIGIPGDSYRVASDDPEVVAAEIAGGAIRLTAGKIGRTMVRLSDDGFSRARMLVEVKKLYELTLEAIPGGLDVLRLDNDGTPKTLRILTGNGGYEAVSSAPESVVAEIAADPDAEGGSVLVLSGRADTDGATVTVTDAKGKSAKVAVRVTAPIRPVAFDVEGPLEGEYVYGGESAPVTFNITAGNGGYEVMSSNEGVAAASVDGTTVTLSIVGDGGTTITVLDRENESRSIELWVPLNTDDPTPRISWDGYRADISTPGVSVRSGYATKKDMYWDHLREDGTTDTWYVFFNGGWVNGLECVKASNRNPKLEVTAGGVNTVYDDKTSAVGLSSFVLRKRIGNTGENPHIYFITFATADGRQGFIVHDWNLK